MGFKLNAKVVGVHLTMNEMEIENQTGMSQWPNLLRVYGLNSIDQLLVLH